MIAKLTKKQEKNIAKTRKKYLDIFYNPANKDIPKEVYVEQYNNLYELIGLPKPKRVIVMDSPLGVQIAYNALWSNLGDKLRDNLEPNLADNLRSNLEASLRDNLRSNLRYNLRSNLGASLRDSLWSNLWSNLRSNLEYNLWVNLWVNLGVNLRVNLRDNLRDKSMSTSFSYYGESTDLYWVCHYMYVVENFDFVPIELANRLRQYEKIITTAPTILNALFPEVAIVSRTPTKCYRDSEGRLHNDEGGIAVEFADGWGLYAIHGVIFNDQDLYLSIVNKTITAEEVARLDNTEHRMIALKYLSPAEFIKGSKAEQVGLTSERGNALYRGSFEEVGEVWFLRFSCPSTGREYIEFTQPVEFADSIRDTNGQDVDIYNPDVLQAFSFVFEFGGKSEHLSHKDYMSMTVET